MNLAVVRGKVLLGGAVMFQCEFVGYEKDGVQDTHICDCSLVESPADPNEAGGAVRGGRLEIASGSKVLAKFYEEGSMNGAVVRGSVVRCHTAAHCNTLQHTATHCNTLQYAETRRWFCELCCRFRQPRQVTTHFNTLQHTAAHRDMLPHNAAHCNTLQYAATHRYTNTGL